MHPSRTPVDWLIVIVNIPAVLLGLAIGWIWIIDAAKQPAGNQAGTQLGMSIGFIMAYLAWNSVIITYLILKHRPPTPSTGEKFKIKRSTLQAALAQSRGEAPAPEPAPELIAAEPPTERITVDPPTEPVAAEPPTERVPADSAVEANWDEALPPIRRQEP